MAKKGSQFTTYHPDFKLQVVEDYLSGKSSGLNLIARIQRACPRVWSISSQPKTRDRR